MGRSQLSEKTGAVEVWSIKVAGVGWMMQMEYARLIVDVAGGKLPLDNGRLMGVDVIRRPTEHHSDIRPVGHQPTCVYELARRVYSGELIL